jgi:hypothetical protein
MAGAFASTFGKKEASLRALAVTDCSRHERARKVYLKENCRAVTDFPSWPHSAFAHSLAAKLRNRSRIKSAASLALTSAESMTRRLVIQTSYSWRRTASQVGRVCSGMSALRLSTRLRCSAGSEHTISTSSKSEDVLVARMLPLCYLSSGKDEATVWRCRSAFERSDEFTDSAIPHTPSRIKHVPLVTKHPADRLVVGHDSGLGLLAAELAVVELRQPHLDQVRGQRLLLLRVAPAQSACDTDLLRTWAFSFYEGPASVSAHLSPVVQPQGFTPINTSVVVAQP